MDILKGKDSPFEVLAHSHQADENFAELYVPEIHQVERLHLQEMIDWYRLSEYHESENLKPSRVVTIRGDRGSGKTILLQSLIFDFSGKKSQVVVRPSFFQADLDFDEYLLGQLKTAMTQLDEFHAMPPFDVIAHALTRRLLRQAILSAGPADRLFAFSASGISRFRFLWGGGEHLLRKLDLLAKQLADPLKSRDLSDTVRKHALSPQMAYRLIEGHLRAQEVGSDLKIGMRRLLYGAMARAVLLQDGDAMPAFLAEGYQRVDPSKISLRSDLVAALLQTLIETCALVQLPVVFAFDDLEHLLPDVQTAEAMVGKLTNAVDSNTRGVLFFIFAEAGLWDQRIAPALSIDTAGRPRWEQGIPLAKQGPVYLIDLKEPTPDQIHQLVRRRIGPLLAGFGEASNLPPNFPFTADFIEDLVGKGDRNLRASVWRLRDEYNRRVYGKALDRAETSTTANAPAIRTGPDWKNLLESTWSRGLSAARRKIQKNAVTQADLHACLAGFLQAALPITVDSWSMVRIRPSLPVGQNPDYGVFTLLDWKADHGSEVAKGPQSLRVAIGFLVANGTGMPPDLRAKFDFFVEYKRGARLVILWLTEQDGESLADLLPKGTHKVWDDQAGYHSRTNLRRIKETDLRNVLAFANFLNDLTEAAQLQPSAEVVRDFLQLKAAKLFPLLQPPVGGIEWVADHEN